MPRSGMSMRRAASPVTLGVCICRPTNMAAQDSSSDMLRDYIIVKFLADRPKNSPPISSLKTDDGLLNNLKALFKEADLPEPMYMNSAANLYNRINHIVNDNKGHLKAKVKTSFAAMQSVLQLCGFNATTGEDVFSAIGTIKRNAQVAAATASVAPVASTVPPVSAREAAPAPTASPQRPSAPETPQVHAPREAPASSPTTAPLAPAPYDGPVTQGGQPLRTCDNSRKANQVLALTAKVKTLEEQIDTLKTKIKQPKMTDFVIRKLDTAAEQALEVEKQSHKLTMSKLQKLVDELAQCELKLQKSSWKPIYGAHNTVRTSFMASIRNLIHCGVPEEKMALVLGHVWAAFFEGDFPEKLPAPNCFRDHVDALGEHDLMMLADEINEYKGPVHWSTDATKRRGYELHAGGPRVFP